MKLSELKSEIKEYIVEILSEEEDREPTKAELDAEKVKGAPSKFKVTNSEFEDFKERLKNLVKKIKAMEKGEAKDKKMAALKQYIKKPELVKAFKERDVKIDTGGLVG
jgi:tRNA(Phe) wybutosine-synthesizing methylase Tyw3